MLLKLSMKVYCNRHNSSA